MLWQHVCNIKYNYQLDSQNNIVRLDCQNNVVRIVFCTQIIRLAGMKQGTFYVRALGGVLMKSLLHVSFYDNHQGAFTRA